MITDKLKNFPPVHFISISESENRRKLLYEKFEKHGITNVTPHIFERYDDIQYDVNGGPYAHTVTGPGRGCIVSHLTSMKDWYFDTDEEYVLFCEDDLSFETVPYWNFTWEEFFNSLPETWECVQLSWVRDDMFKFSTEGITLRSRCWCDWSSCAFLMKRSHVKKLIGQYYRNGKINLQYGGIDSELRDEWALYPVAEQVLYTVFTPLNYTTIYGFPLFVEDVYGCESTMYGGSIMNFKSYETIMNWWKTIGKNLTLDQIIK